MHISLVALATKSFDDVDQRKLKIIAHTYGTREGTCEFYFLTCSDDLICCSNDLISCLHNLSSCVTDIIKLL